MNRCARCSAELETPLGCSACGALAVLADDPGPFAVLGIDPAYAIDPQELRRRLVRFSRMTHPDFFATADEEQRLRAERATALLNEAYATLSDDVARADHLVETLGGPDENVERAMPQEFLMEVLEWNETLEEAREPEAVPDTKLEALQRDLQDRRARTLAEIARRLTPLPAHGSPALRDVRRELNAVRYVDRALRQIEGLRLSRAEAR